MSILSLGYFVCFFPETWWEFHDVGEWRLDALRDEAEEKEEISEEEKLRMWRPLMVERKK